MSKIKVFVAIKNEFSDEFLESIYTGILTDQKVIYYGDERTVTISRNSNTIEMIQRGNESSTVLTFNKEKIETGMYEIKGIGTFEIMVETSLLEVKNNEIHICYKTILGSESMGSFDFGLRYEVIK